MTPDMLIKGIGKECNCNLFKVNGWATKEKQDITLVEMKAVWKACLKIESEMKGKATSFHIDNQIMVAYLKSMGTRCTQSNQVAWKFFLKCHWDRVISLIVFSTCSPILF